MRKRLWLLLSSSSIAALNGAPFALAATPQSGSSSRLEEVVVTAQRRSQNINKVGLAITAVGGRVLEQKGITQVSDLVKIEPSLQFAESQSGTPVYTLRGVGYFEQSLSATPAVSIYEDEFGFPYPVMSRGVLLDTSRVEILKGPQGTLYGQNATGGAINFIEAKPTKEFHFGIDTSYDNFNDSLTSGYVSGSLLPTLQARLSGSEETGGAWQKSVTNGSTLGDKNTQIGRLLLDYKPIDSLKVSFNVNGWLDKSDTQAAQLEGFRFQDPANIAVGDPTNPAFYFPAPYGSAAYDAYPAQIKQLLSEPVSTNNARQADWVAGTKPRNNENFVQSNLRLDFDPSPAFGITSLTNYEHFHENNLVDPTANAFVANQTDQIQGTVETFSQEVRLHGLVLADKVHWLLGANFERDRSDEVDSVTTVGSVSFAPVALGLPPYFHFGAINKDVAVTKSVFANVDYQITNQVNLHGGIRYTKSDQSLDGCSTSSDASVNILQTAVSQELAALYGSPGGVGVPGQCVTLGPPPNFLPGNIHNTLNQSNVPWRVGIDWSPIKDGLVYFSVSKGFKAGTSPALGASNFDQLTPVVQESLLAYELGVKQALFNQSLRVTGALFHYDYTDKQELGRLQDPVYGAVQTLLNIPKSELDGAEAGVVWSPVEGLNLNAGATYLDSKVTSDFFNTGPYPVNGSLINFKGDPFPFTPKWSLQYGAQYTCPLQNGMSVFFGFDGSYQTKSVAAFGSGEAAATGSPSLAVNQYALLNLNAGLTSPDGRWRLLVFGKNVTNTYYWSTLNYIADSTTRFAGRPTSYGVDLSYRF